MEPSPDDRPEATPQGEPSETAQHYVETIFYIRFEEGRVRPGRLAEWLGVSPPTVTVTLRRLARDGWVSIGDDHGVSLTERGEQLAESVVRVHRLLERWLTDALGFDWASADAQAQLLAPGVSEDVAARLDETLGRPATCPHGNVIPGRVAPYGELVPLAELTAGQSARIRRISEVAEHDAPELLRELDSLGLRMGVTVRLPEAVSGNEPLSVEVGGGTRSIPGDYSRVIWVELL